LETASNGAETGKICRRRVKISSGSAVISKQATKAFSAADVPASRKRSWGGEEQGVPFALMVAFRMEMANELGHGSVE
jgi:hypothetical protein